MNWFTKWLARRSLGNPTPDEWALFASPTDAGVMVTPETALQVPVVTACIKVLSEDVAKTPLRLREQIGADAYVDALDHPLFELLHDLPNPEVDAFTFIRELTADMLLYGVAYALIVRVEDRVTALWRLPRSIVRVDRDAARRKRWHVSTTTGVETYVFDPSMPPILELRFDSPLHRCRELIGSLLALQQYIAKFFANGARPGGLLKAPGAISDATAARLKETWQSLFQGSAKAHRVAVLADGLEFVPIAAQNDHSQLNELLMTLRNEICGCFRVPPFKVSDLSNANYSNVESLSIEYVTGSLDPIFRAWELALRRDLLTARQYGRYTVMFDRSALIQSDMRSLFTALATARQSGIYSVNDCRRRLGENPIPNGDDYLVNAALVPIAQGAPNVA